MLAQPSALSLVACALYAIVAFSAWRAGLAARGRGQQPWHTRTWIFVTIFFILLIVSRLFGLEEMLRAGLREMLQVQDVSENRRSIQGPIIAAAIIAFASAGMFAVYWISQRLSGRRNIAVAVAVGACGVMLATIAMRTVSLHALDRLLNGPLKLNWVGDIGASLAVFLAAAVYARIVSGKMPRRR